MNEKQIKKLERENERAQMKEFILNYFKQVQEGKAITLTAIKHVSRSGMSRIISFTGVYVDASNKMKTTNLNYYIHELLGYAYGKNHYGVSVGGCGMDLIFNTLYQLFQCVQPGGEYNSDYAVATEYRPA